MIKLEPLIIERIGQLTRLSHNGVKTPWARVNMIHARRFAEHWLRPGQGLIIRHL